ncbi:MAG: LPS export ABC transporter ATP-binding protein [Planctomycetota bacterium]
MTEVLSVHGLVKRYSGKTVVNGVSFTVRSGTIFGLLGPNGAGKTTTFKMIMGIVRPDGGEVMIGSDPIGSLPMYRRARLGLGYLAQEPAVISSFTVEENIYALLEARGVPLKAAKARASDLLEEMRLTYLLGKKASYLSGGERRRLEIARTLSFDPKVLLLDEPFSGIDPKSVEEIQEHIVELKHRGLGILLTDHNVRETFSITDSACIIEKGMIIAAGSPEELVNDSRVRETYLGRKFRL